MKRTKYYTGNKRDKRKKNKKLVSILVGITLLLIISVSLGLKIYFSSLVYSEVRTEAGVSVSSTDFVAKQLSAVSFTKKFVLPNSNAPGEYPVEIKHWIFKKKSKLIITDSIAPTAEIRNVDIYMGETCDINTFIVSTTDATPVTVKFATRPDLTKPGAQNVEIIVSDSSGNVNKYPAELYITSLLAKDIEIEIGEPLPTLSDFVGEAREYKTDVDISQFDNTVLGMNSFILTADGRDTLCSVKVVDSKKPELVAQDLTGYINTEWTPDEFVTSCNDATEVTLSFETAPDTKAVGEQQVKILAADQGGNISEAVVKLTLQQDTEKPVISGVKDKTCVIGEPIQYMENVTYTDNCEKGLVFEVLHDDLDPQKEGVYTVTYRATDAAGNVTEKKAAFTMVIDKYSDYYVQITTEKIYKSIIKDGMDDLERLRAIYDYVVKHMSYASALGIGHSDKNKAFWYAVNWNCGDCFGYACLAQALLDYGGFDAYMIEKVKRDPSYSTHFWHLVNIGDGYYHFDTCLRSDRPEIFMWNDITMMTYSELHLSTHFYDRENNKVNKDGDIYKFMYGPDAKRPYFKYGNTVDKYLSEGGTFEKFLKENKYMIEMFPD